VSRVSVIIPAFNAATHIAESLGSVVAQTFGDWEAIVADDFSTDATAEIAAGFGPRVKVVRSSENRGPAAARNLALDKANGELVALLDADDYWLPEYLERQVALYDRASDLGERVGIVTCDAYISDGGEPGPKTLRQVVGFPEELTLSRLLERNSIFVSALSPRAVIEEVGGFCEEIVGTEDYDLWLRIVEQGYGVVASRAPLAVYRVADQSISADAGRMARALQLTYQRALARGSLTPRQRWIVRRNLRLQRAVERLSAIRAARRAGVAVPAGKLARAVPLLLWVAAENPNRWFPVAGRMARGDSPYPRRGPVS
jgi:glycosyltransferase involved in cell wall biosynthesis